MKTSLDHETRRYRATLVLSLACLGLALCAGVAVVVASAPQWTPLIIAVGVAPLPLMIHAQLRLSSAHARRYTLEAANLVARSVDEAAQALRATRDEIATAEGQRSLQAKGAAHDTRVAADRLRRKVDAVSQALRDTQSDLRSVEARLSLQGHDAHETLIQGFDRLHRAGLAPAMATVAQGHRELVERIDAVGAQLSTGISDARRESISVESRLLREMDFAAALIREVTGGLRAEVRSLEEGTTTGRGEIVGHLRQLSSLIQTLNENSSTIAGTVASLGDDFRSTAQREVELFEEGRKTTMSVYRQVESGFLSTRVSLEQMPHVVSEYQTVRDQVAPGRLNLPMLGGWIVTSPVVSFIAGRIFMSDRPLTVLELGSGASTLWTAMAIERAGHGVCFSLDHSQDFAERTRELLRAQDVETYADVRHAPLVPVEVHGDTYDFYDLAAVPDDLRVDILFVDGPPATHGENNRYPAVPLLIDRLVPGALIILDDTIRQDERDAIARWRDEYPHISWQGDLGKATLLRVDK